MEVAILAGIALVRILGAVVYIAIRLIAFLFFAPIWRSRPRQRAYAEPRARRRSRCDCERYDPRNSILYQLGGLIGDLRGRTVVYVREPTRRVAGGSSASTAEPSRNERDCALALQELGYPAKQARDIAGRVAAELGSDAPLNDMVKRALQLGGTAR